MGVSNIAKNNPISQTYFTKTNVMQWYDQEVKVAKSNKYNQQNLIQNILCK